MYIDSHCHINFDEFANEVDDVLGRAKASGIDAFLNIACRLEEIDRVLMLSTTYPQIFASIGVHPHEATATLTLLKTVSIEQALKAYLPHPRVVAIGETGLDFYYNHSTANDQERSFREQIELALQEDLPVIVHTRDAEADTIRILKDYAGRLRGVIHCFSGTQWLADEALALGFYISFSGIVTFPKATDIQTTAKIIPLDRLLIETDAPFLAPVPKRGKRNEPAFLVHTAEFLAQLKDVSASTIAECTMNNFYSLFDKATRILS